MTTNQFNSVAISDTDANFRDWGSKLSVGLATVGMIQTADTGQINWATVIKPSSGNQQVGYEIWRFNDSLQSTYPIYLRLAYGSGTSATAPSIWVSVGKSSDGAGTLGGVFRVATQVFPNNSSASTQTSFLSSGDGSQITFTLFVSLSNVLAVSIERSRNSSGVANGDGLVLCYKSSSAAATQFAYQYSTMTQYSPNNNSLGLSMPYGGTMISGSAAPVLMISAFVPSYLWQLRSVVVGASADVGVGGTTMSIPGLGTYISTGSTGWDSSVSSSSGTAVMAWF